jgi:hypothetical protein
MNEIRNDHDRLCQGREYTCTCGYDAERDAEIKRLREALTPSGSTMAAYIGEFRFSYTVWDPHGEFEITHEVIVPWATTKKIMAAISARAALNGGSDAP